MKLKEIAHSRTGDKGNISNISLIAYDKKDFNKIRQMITPELIKDHFEGIVKGDVVIYDFLFKIFKINGIFAICVD